MKRPTHPASWVLLLLVAASTGAPAPVRAAAAAAKFTPETVRVYAEDEGLYDPKVLRTLFLNFEKPNWEQQLTSNYRTNLELPAKLTVDGKVYPGVGVSFRGNSSYQMVPYGKKHSLSLSIDAADDSQRLLGFRSLKLLNANQDPSFMRTFLYQYVARQFAPAPRVNFVRVVINGENWGIYVNTEAINSNFTKEQFGSSKGARWKIANSPRNAGGLYYYGDNVASYRNIYELRSQEDPKAWADLIHLCKVLNRTPPDKLEEALKPILDVDGALKFLALDHALQNADGYWTKAGEYSLYEDPNGVFHVVMWDVNESFKEAGGGSGMLDPYAGAGEQQKALLYYLLAVPSFDKRYLGYMRDIAENWLTWEKLGPVVEQAQALIKDDIAADTRKLFSTEAFITSSVQDYYNPGTSSPRPPEYSLKGFIRDRRAYLLAYPGIRPEKKP